MTVPQLTPVALGAAPQADRPLLVLGPSLGTTATALWGAAACLLSEQYRVVGWELPGHGRGAPDAGPFGLEDLAEAVHRMVRALQREAGREDEPCLYAGVSVGGAVGLHLALDHPEDVAALAVLCSGARIGRPEDWTERAELVEASGTPTQVIGSAQRWFAPGFLEKQPVVATELLHGLQEADRHSYAAVCRALAAADVRSRLGEVRAPVLTVAGACDEVTGPEVLAEIAEGVPDGEQVVLLDAAHLVPAEDPERTAEELLRFFDARIPEGRGPDVATSEEPSAAEPSGLPDRDASRARVLDEGLAVRRQVLSDEHVDRAQAATTEFTAPFQDLISRYAWGEIWTRPGLDRRMRSAVTLTAMVALGHWSEFEMHVRAALRNGLDPGEIREILLQCAVYCGVPAANTAFARAQRVLAEAGALPTEDQKGRD